MLTAPSKPLHGCVPALDGFLSARVKPNIEDDVHYHSIHKKIHCLNVQAALIAYYAFDMSVLQCLGGQMMAEH
jgi:hypothetical protein